MPREACNRPERTQDRRTRQVDRRCTRLQQTVGGTCHPNGGKSCLHTFHLWSPMCKVPMTADHQIIVRRVADWHASCCPSPRQGAVQLPRCCHNVAEDTKHKSDGREPTSECEFWFACYGAFAKAEIRTHATKREYILHKRNDSKAKSRGRGRRDLQRWAPQNPEQPAPCSSVVSNHSATCSREECLSIACSSL